MVLLICVCVWLCVKVLAGCVSSVIDSSCHFVSTSFHDEFLADMMQSHMVKDFCIIGPRVVCSIYLYCSLGDWLQV